MIYINNIPYNINTFPDGTFCEFNFKKYPYDKAFEEIVWHYESDSEMIALYYIVKHIKTLLPLAKIKLKVCYLPNARMDRVKNCQNEIFTLKYFCDFINSLNFYSVAVLDPHSDVSVALLNNCCALEPTPYINATLSNINKLDVDKPRIYFPDAGALKRYSKLSCFKGYDFIYGNKQRNWETGEILGLEIMDKNGYPLRKKCVFDENKNADLIFDSYEILPLQGETILMVDDIISYGSTLAYSADNLKELGAENIYVYATHTEQSILNDEKSKLLPKLREDTIKKIFTTNSIANREESEYITVFNIY